tara:strand:+ start:9306 stop:10796 length:1491 start_codon:yes stop_codon:yes gene_type:complete
MNVYIATISEPNPLGNNYTIETGDGEDPTAVSLSQTSGNDGDSSSTITYEAGQEVLCVDIRGTPVILGTLPKEFGRTGESGKAVVQDTELNTKSTPESKFVQESLFSRIGEHNSFGFGVPESLPGDIITRTPGGGALKLLSGGVNILDSGTARVTTNAETSKVSIDCSSFSLNTGFGNLDIGASTGGGFSLDFKGNTNPGAMNINRDTEPTPNVNLRLDNGFKVVSGSGYGLTIEPSGKVTILGESLFLKTNRSEFAIVGGDDSNEELHEVNSAEIKSNASRRHSIESSGDSVENCGGDLLKTAGKRAKYVYNGPTPMQDALIAVNPAGSYTHESHVISGSDKKVVGSLVTGGGKEKKEIYGDIHMSTQAHARGGGSIVIDCSTAPGAISNGAWNNVTVAKTKLTTGILASTPAIPTDGLVNPWTALAPVPGGLNPALSGYCRYAQLQMFMQALIAAVTPLSAAPGGTGIAGFVASAPLLLLPVESKHNYENYIPA